jgi:hypothetical protein
MNVREGLNAAQTEIQNDINFLIGVRNHTAPNHNAGKKLGEITYKDHKKRITDDIIKNYGTGHPNVIINLETNVVDAIGKLIKRRDAAK